MHASDRGHSEAPDIVRQMEIGLIGCGNMARALARGWGRPLLCADPIAERARSLAAEVGGEALASNAELAARADLLVLCHKPAQLAAVAGEVGAGSTPVASILAVTPLAALREAYPGRPVYRFIPSLPVEVRQGAVVQAAGPGSSTTTTATAARMPSARRSTRPSRRCSPSWARWWCSTTRSWTWRWA